MKKIKIRPKLEESHGTLNLVNLPILLDLVEQDIHSSIEAYQEKGPPCVNVIAQHQRNERLDLTRAILSNQAR